MDEHTNTYTPNTDRWRDFHPDERRAIQAACARGAELLLSKSMQGMVPPAYADEAATNFLSLSLLTVELGRAIHGGAHAHPAVQMFHEVADAMRVNDYQDLQDNVRRLPDYRNDDEQDEDAA